MPLIVEDGSNVDGANSFVSREDVIAYAEERGIVLTDDITTDVLAIKAMDWIIGRPCLKGVPAYTPQSLPFPRKGLVKGDLAPGYDYTIPSGVVRCQLQLCLDVFNGVDLMPTIEATASNASRVQSEKLGPLSTTYFDSTSSTSITAPLLPIAQAAIGPYLCAGAGPLRTYRA